jgi:hypothetical protein
MIPRTLLSDYDAWKTDRTGESLTLPQYITSLLQTKAHTASLVLALTTLAAPELRRREDYVLIEELFSESRFRDVKGQTKDPGEVEYWMNLLGVSDTFHSVMSNAQCEYVAYKLQYLWRGMLDRGNLFDYDCRLIRDEEEWYVTICRKSAFPQSGSTLFQRSMQP